VRWCVALRADTSPPHLHATHTARYTPHPTHGVAADNGIIVTRPRQTSISRPLRLLAGSFSTTAAAAKAATRAICWAATSSANRRGHHGEHGVACARRCRRRGAGNGGNAGQQGVTTIVGRQLPRPRRGVSAYIPTNYRRYTPPTATRHPPLPALFHTPRYPPAHLRARARFTGLFSISLNSVNVVAMSSAWHVISNK